MSRSIRERSEERERQGLGPHARLAADTRGRVSPEPSCPVRTAFQEDVHRIVGCKAFRRLKGKTQVFLWPEGDHYRTRLTHCQEVSQIARALSRALMLNEDLAEAIALGHDLGHTPFGHAGEEVLTRLHPAGFRHELQSLRVVERLENDGRGLNLTAEVRDGILRHSKGVGSLLEVPLAVLPGTIEGQLVRLADLVAYVNHDIDDAVRAGVLRQEELPGAVLEVLGQDWSTRVVRIIEDIVDATRLDEERRARMSPAVVGALEALRDFLYERVYYNEDVHAEFRKASLLLTHLWEHFMSDLDAFYTEGWPGALRDGPPEDDVRDFLAGMTDAYAVGLHERLFTPRRWFVF